MKRQNFLKIIVFISIAAVALLPTYIVMILEPSFVHFITKQTEQEAVNVATHMADMFFENHPVITREHLPANFKYEISQLQEEFHIVKVKVFSPEGEIVFSTSYDEIGTMNKHPYFHTEVAQGKVYTKVVRKNTQTLEGQNLAVDVVETYVPIIKKRTFAGAFEIYYDITETKGALSKLLDHSKQTSILFSFCLLFAVIITAILANRSITRQKEAEQKLREAHDRLEVRVKERTDELNTLNQTLEAEIAERKVTEIENQELIQELQNAIEQVKTLKGLLPICSSCQKIRDKEGTWNKIDEYIQENTEVELTHGICPTCAKKLYPDLYAELEDQ